MKLFAIGVSYLALTSSGQSQIPGPQGFLSGPDASAYAVDLLGDTAVQKDLLMTKWQYARILSINELRFINRPEPGLSGAESRARQEKYMQYVEKSSAILTPWQKERLAQIWLQVEGPAVVTRSKVIRAKLGVTDEQLEAISKLAWAFVDEMKAGSLQPRVVTGHPDSPAMKEAAASFNKMDEGKIRVARQTFALLTPAQRQKWAAMVGKSFDRGEGRMRPPGSPLVLKQS
jgi:hypothetical protein